MVCYSKMLGGHREAFLKIQSRFSVPGFLNTSFIRKLFNLWKYFHLPFSAVVLMILFHPFRYPKDSEKLMLARQTGLTRSQVFLFDYNIFLITTPTV
jgi:hypothetical protein